MCDMTHSYVRRDSFLCQTRLLHMWDMTYSFGWHGSCAALSPPIQTALKSVCLHMCVTWCTHMCDMTHSYVWHDSSLCVTRLMHMCDMTHTSPWPPAQVPCRKTTHDHEPNVKGGKKDDHAEGSVWRVIRVMSHTWMSHVTRRNTWPTTTSPAQCKGREKGSMQKGVSGESQGSSSSPSGSNARPASWCVCEREREGERETASERERKRKRERERVCVCVCACALSVSVSWVAGVEFLISEQLDPLQHTATHCNALQHTATHCVDSRVLHSDVWATRPTATHCNTLQHTATHCNTLRQ